MLRRRCSITLPMVAPSRTERNHGANRLFDNHVCGLLINGFQHPPTVLTAHNPPYYARLIEACGFEKVTDWYAWWFDPVNAPVARLRRLVDARARRTSVKIRPIDLRRVADESHRLSAVFNEAWKNNWGFVPFTEAEAKHMADEMRPIIDPRMTLIAEVDNAPVRVRDLRARH